MCSTDDNEVKTVKLMEYDQPYKISLYDDIGKEIPVLPGDVRIGSVVWVRTPTCEEKNIILWVRVVGQDEGGFVGQVVDESHDARDNDLVYPGEYLEFEIEGIRLGERIRLSRKNVMVLVG